MFENAGIACHQCRRGKAKDLPVGKVPGHQGQHDAKRLKRDVAIGRIRRDMLVCQELFSILGIVFAVPGALLDFGLRFDDGLTHF